MKLIIGNLYKIKIPSIFWVKAINSKTKSFQSKNGIILLYLGEIDLKDAFYCDYYGIVHPSLALIFYPGEFLEEIKC